MMTSLKEELDRVEVGDPLHHRNLTLFPLLRPTTTDMDYLLLEDAIQQGLAKVTELPGGGSVPELRFENTGERPVLLLDGEELVGAKQNRVLNLTILAPAKQNLLIPVSCVEAGRWHMTTPAFRTGTDFMYSRARATRMTHVTESMRTRRTRRSNQAALWDDIAQKAARFDAESPTQAMSAMYDRLELSMEDYVRAFGWQDRQAGMAFAISGQLRGLDLLDHTSTMRRTFAKFVRSYAIDAMDAPREQTEAASRLQLTEFLAEVAGATTFAQEAVGLGKDLRLISPRVSGAALWASDRFVHVCAFAGGHNGNVGFHTRMSGPSHRGG